MQLLTRPSVFSRVRFRESALSCSSSAGRRRDRAPGVQRGRLGRAGVLALWPLVNCALTLNATSRFFHQWEDLTQLRPLVKNVVSVIVNEHGNLIIGNSFMCCIFSVPSLQITLLCVPLPNAEPTLFAFEIK